MDAVALLSVAEDLAEVTRLTADDDVEATLTRFVHRVVHTVPSCDAAFFTTVFRDGVETLAGTWRPRGTTVAELGPIADAFRYREPRRLGDIGLDRRYPTFSAELTAAGFRTALVLPLSRGADEPATLTLLSRTPDSFAESSFDMVQLLAVHAGVALDNASVYSDCRALVDQLSTSLRTRSTIGQAQGLVMAGAGVDAEAAFGLLRGASQRRNVKLRDLAAELIAAHVEGSFEATARARGVLGG